MRIEHIALWTSNIEAMKDFYVKYFGAEANDLYTNSDSGFQSYFLSFNQGARLEIMSMSDVSKKNDPKIQYLGYVHIAISVGSKERVVELTYQLNRDGYKVVGQPRTTGDGYFESVILDPEGNRIEITC